MHPYLGRLSEQGYSGALRLSSARPAECCFTLSWCSLRLPLGVQLKMLTTRIIIACRSLYAYSCCVINGHASTLPSRLSHAPLSVHLYLSHSARFRFRFRSQFLYEIRHAGAFLGARCSPFSSLAPLRLHLRSNVVSRFSRSSAFPEPSPTTPNPFGLCFRRCSPYFRWWDGSLKVGQSHDALSSARVRAQLIRGTPSQTSHRGP
ncbi:hypothetical protein HETIRDRAFT_386567 [Heterobasidion irregulare TC 32-1]|uniref:Uncharacterized protein n=1 Tax=Heterobasidion irregulare (strain TC 32-1) TaxID=747525 RepID=W4K4V1_HETIT|nr:uncharacterized protein HETIRDRAFT_386567 [Heterobasidion irregulare TC 32-1]ETW80086.1 hypothetical protein HETIRDRAFT_386567 [Heterobasidion irregulare TC 32-1]